MRTRSLIFALILLAAGFFAGQHSVLPSERVTGVYSMEDPTSSSTVDFEPFWKAWNLINEKYAGINDVTAEEKMWGAIEGLANSLGDPYTVFLPPEESLEFEEMISGVFGGVGMEIGKEDGAVVVIAPLKGTPAERAGVRAGDRILEINGTSTHDLSVDDAVNLIRGEPGTKVTLTTLHERSSEPLKIEIVREMITVPTLHTELLDEGIFVISLYSFDAHATRDFRAAMQEFETSGSDRLILDVRGNPGGFLDAAIAIASYFIPEGEVVVREASSDRTDEQIHRSRGFARVGDDVEVVVLVNRGSASASEIVAGALQEHGAATLIGETTFGKGSVQELVPVTSTTALKLTVAEWLTPDGNSISENGLTPDIEVLQSEEDTELQRDAQFEAAVEFLSR